jgi:hypothetical protein
VAEDVVEVLVADVVRLLVVVRIRAHGRHRHLVVERVALHVMAAVLVVVVGLVLDVDVDVAVAVAVDVNSMLRLVVLEFVAHFLHHGLVGVDNILALCARDRGCGAVKRVFLFGALEVGGQLVLVDPAAGSAEGWRFGDSVDSTLLHDEAGKMGTPGELYKRSTMAQLATAGRSLHGLLIPQPPGTSGSCASGACACPQGSLVWQLRSTSCLRLHLVTTVKEPWNGLNVNEICRRAGYISYIFTYISRARFSCRLNTKLLL